MNISYYTPVVPVRQLHSIYPLVSFRVDGLNIEVVYGQATSLGMDCWSVDPGACEAERRGSVASPVKGAQRDQQREKRHAETLLPRHHHTFLPYACARLCASTNKRFNNRAVFGFSARKKFIADGEKNNYVQNVAEDFVMQKPTVKKIYKHSV